MNIPPNKQNAIYENSFVFGEIEVKKTGRTASKPLPGNKVMVLVEVTPINEYDGTWKKFVNPNALFTIQSEEK